jgi:hypothetical protein
MERGRVEVLVRALSARGEPPPADLDCYQQDVTRCLDVCASGLKEIAFLRDDYGEEMNCQIIHDLIHWRSGWTQEYVLDLDGVAVGYGSLAEDGPWRYNSILVKTHSDKARISVSSFFSCSGVNRSLPSLRAAFFTDNTMAFFPSGRSAAPYRGMTPEPNDERDPPPGKPLKFVRSGFVYRPAIDRGRLVDQ